MLGRKYRFKGHGSVSRVRGQSYRSANLSLRASKNQRASARCAVVVSKKISPKAVVRNRIRRRIFELLRTHPSLSHTSVDVVVYVQTIEPEAMPSELLKNELYSLISRANPHS